MLETLYYFSWIIITFRPIEWYIHIFISYIYCIGRQKWKLKMLKNNYTIPINTVYWACDTLPRSHAHVIVIGPCCACALRFNFSETVKVSNIYNEKKTHEQYRSFFWQRCEDNTKMNLHNTLDYFNFQYLFWIFWFCFVYWLFNILS